MSTSYLDASALVKLFKPEAESAELARRVEDRIWISAEIVVVEVICTARRLGDDAMLQRAERLAARLELVPLTAHVRGRALQAFARPLRSLDALHAAAALSVAEDLDLAVVYDIDLAAAMSAEGITVESPGVS